MIVNLEKLAMTTEAPGAIMPPPGAIPPPPPAYIEVLQPEPVWKRRLRLALTAAGGGAGAIAGLRLGDKHIKDSDLLRLLTLGAGTVGGLWLGNKVGDMLVPRSYPTAKIPINNYPMQ